MTDWIILAIAVSIPAIVTAVHVWQLSRFDR